MLWLLLLGCTLQAQPVRKAEKIVADHKVIWGFDFLNNDEIILTEKDGKMFVVNLKTKKESTVANVPVVNSKGQGGLLDIKLHPDFAKNKWVYFTYSYSNGKLGGTRLSRAKLVNNALTDIQDVFTAEPLHDSNLHYGSRIAFDGNGHVFVSLGERYQERDKAQDLNTHFGKIIRLKEDGSIPDDNPFVGDKTKKPEIWSYGHRNPQGIFYDKDTKLLWASEHGPMGGDEINLIQKGKNYGWPVVTYGRDYSGAIISEQSRKPGIEDAIHVYVPSIAPSSLLIYKGKIYPEWNNHFFQGALVLQHLNIIQIKDRKFVSGSEKRLFQNEVGRVRYITQSPNGYLYFSTDSGEIYLIQ